VAIRTNLKAEFNLVREMPSFAENPENSAEVWARLEKTDKLTRKRVTDKINNLLQARDGKRKNQRREQQQSQLIAISLVGLCSRIGTN